jgi:hypothetical protein
MWSTLRSPWRDRWSWWPPWSWAHLLGAEQPGRWRGIMSWTFQRTSYLFVDLSSGQIGSPQVRYIVTKVGGSCGDEITRCHAPWWRCAGAIASPAASGPAAPTTEPESSRRHVILQLPHVRMFAWDVIISDSVDRCTFSDGFTPPIRYTNTNCNKYHRMLWALHSRRRVTYRHTVQCMQLYMQIGTWRRMSILHLCLFCCVWINVIYKWIDVHYHWCTCRICRASIHLITFM